MDGTTQSVSAPTQLVEGMLTEGRKLFPLKNGTEISGAIGQETWRLLQDLYDREPEHFASLLALAEGRGADVPPGHVIALQHDLLLGGDDGAIISDVKNVLLSAAQMTPEGLVLVNPFRVTTQTEAVELQQAHDDFMEKFRRMVRGDGDDTNKGRPPGRR